MRIDGQTDMTNIIIFFHNFAKASTNPRDVNQRKEQAILPVHLALSVTSETVFPKIPQFQQENVAENKSCLNHK